MEKNIKLNVICIKGVTGNYKRMEILKIKKLRKYFKSPKGIVKAVDGIDLSLEKGKTLGIVGESGCGKSTTGRMVAKLLEPTEGEIFFEGKNILKIDKKYLKILRRDIQIIFQDPYSSLNPRMTIREIIEEPLIIHKLCKNKDERDIKVKEVMRVVGLNESLEKSYPHEVDGGKRQRVGIARAIILEPKLIVCDEPVSALDVSIQAQILNLLKDLQERMGLTYIFITHDLSVVKFFADDIAVMYLGEIVEKAKTEELFENPKHPYTKALIDSIPSIKNRGKIKKIKGEIGSLKEFENGCKFFNRCSYSSNICNKNKIELIEKTKNHFIRCCEVENEEV